MRRSTKIVGIALCLGILGAILPVAATIWLSWSQALRQEHRILMDYSNSMMLKTHDSFDIARGVLSTLQNEKEMHPCSKEHINKMLMQRILTSSELIAYFENGTEKCSSYGMPTNPLIRQKAYFTMKDGLEISLDAKPFPDLPISMLSLRKLGNYDVFMRVDELSDVILPEEVQLAIVYNNRLFQVKITPVLFLLKMS